MSVSTPPPPPKPKRDQWRAGLAAGAGVLAVIFALVNIDDVRVHWIVTTRQAPLIVVIGISFMLGAVTGALVWRRRGRG